MAHTELRATISRLLKELTRKTKEYNERLKGNYKMEAAKKIRVRIKIIKNDISRLMKKNDLSMFT
jgi:hypothetical protein